MAPTRPRSKALRRRPIQITAAVIGAGGAVLAAIITSFGGGTPAVLVCPAEIPAPPAVYVTV